MSPVYLGGVKQAWKEIGRSRLSLALEAEQLDSSLSQFVIALSARLEQVTTLGARSVRAALPSFTELLPKRVRT